MRKFIFVAVLAAVGLSVAACSREDRTDIKEGAVATGAEIKDAAGDIADNPEVKDAAVDVQAGVADASDEARREADEARAAAGDTTRKP